MTVALIAIWGYGNDSRQSGPFGDFADRPALRASRCVFHFQSLGDYEPWSKLLPCNRAAKKGGFITRSACITCGDMARFVTNRCRTPLIQIDGSDHHWFEQLVDPCTLRVF